MPPPPTNKALLRDLLRGDGIGGGTLRFPWYIAGANSSTKGAGDASNSGEIYSLKMFRLYMLEKFMETWGHDFLLAMKLWRYRELWHKSSSETWPKGDFFWWLSVRNFQIWETLKVFSPIPLASHREAMAVSCDLKTPGWNLGNLLFLGLHWEAKTVRGRVKSNFWMLVSFVAKQWRSE